MYQKIHDYTFYIINAIISFFLYLRFEAPLLLGLLILIFTDFVLGVYIALNPRYKHVKFSSTTLIVRMVSKLVLYAVLISMGYGVWLILIGFSDWWIWKGIATFFSLGFAYTILILAETGSIIEHLKTMGLPIVIMGIDFTDTIADKWHQVMDMFHDTKPPEYMPYGDYMDNGSSVDMSTGADINNLEEP
jgi:hypothetical protein